MEQACLANEAGFAKWTDFLTDYVEWACLGLNSMLL